METPPQISVGAFTIALLSDGLWRNDGGCMFGAVPRALWQRNHPADEHNRIRLNLTCPLIIKGADAILVDTGIGNRLSDVERKIFAHREGWLPEALAALKIEPGDITYVVLSHLHFDHCGGVVRRRPSGRLEAAFPRARHLIQRGELELARSSRNERLRAAYRHVAECLEPIAGSIEPVSGSSEVIAGVEAIVTGGHTTDHQVIVVESQGQHFAHLADIVPTQSHMKGPWNQAYDLDPIRTMEEKAGYLNRAVAEGWWVSFAHDDRVLAARVANDQGKLVLTERVDASEPVAEIE
ncbi:MAG TPA: MBL fold metallo-hydrolase [Bradyrhizobium sp.]|nr:MBL fold metallo-hydrolase [Bradyrhizobium sp.]